MNIYERIDDSASINRALVAAGVAVSEISVKSMELEAFYMNLTGEENQ
jgi:ABC-2 type transport system ATP-binding protein